MTLPAVVVAAHNRPQSLRRLLRSLNAAVLPDDTPLIVSIDAGAANHDEVLHVAQTSGWPAGDVRIIEHDQIGLVANFHACGDLTEQYGSIVLLEDDLIVGPGFYDWAVAALQHGSSDDRVAGVSLATPFFDGYRHLPFEPVVDGSDGVYLQVPWYDGMAWTHDMWRRYRHHGTDASTALHRSLNELGNDEWFPDAMRYLVETGRYYLLPRHAQATNSGAPGAHFAQPTNYFQVALAMRGASTWRLHSIDDSLAVYDDHMELLPLVVRQIAPELADVDFAVDLLGVRDVRHIEASNVLTTRDVRGPTRLWGSSLHPLVANLAYNTPGDTIRLAAIADLVDSASSQAASFATLSDHATRGRQPSNRDAARQIASGIKGKLTRGR